MSKDPLTPLFELMLELDKKTALGDTSSAGIPDEEVQPFSFKLDADRSLEKIYVSTNLESFADSQFFLCVLSAIKTLQTSKTDWVITKKEVPRPLLAELKVSTNLFFQGVSHGLMHYSRTPLNKKYKSPIIKGYNFVIHHCLHKVGKVPQSLLKGSASTPEAQFPLGRNQNLDPILRHCCALIRLACEKLSIKPEDYPSYIHQPKTLVGKLISKKPMVKAKGFYTELDAEAFNTKHELSLKGYDDLIKDMKDDKSYWSNFDTNRERVNASVRVAKDALSKESKIRSKAFYEGQTQNKNKKKNKPVAELIENLDWQDFCKACQPFRLLGASEWRPPTNFTAGSSPADNYKKIKDSCRAYISTCSLDPTNGLGLKIMQWCEQKVRPRIILD